MEETTATEGDGTSVPRSTLRAIRKASGLTLRQVLERMAAFDSTMPRTHPTLLYIERQGTENLPTLRALAAAYERPLAEIEEAARPANKTRKGSVDFSGE